MPPRQEERERDTASIRDDVRKIVGERDYERLVQCASEWGKELASRNLRMAQIRRVFGEIKQLQMRWEPARLRMLRPRLAYVAARAGQGGELLRDILTPAIDTVFQGAGGEEQRRRFSVMADLLEAILAHYAEGERRQGRRAE